MKRKQREVSAFNMSAVDLFASSMGAFILLAVIALPFFPKTGETPAPIPPPEPVPVPECPDVPVIPTHAVPSLDLIIVMDITYSMKPQIKSLQETTAELIELLSKLSSSLAVGVVFYGDELYDQPIHKLDLIEIPDVPSTEFDTLKAFINTGTAEMGRGSGTNTTTPEALGLALEHAVSNRFRSSSERRLVLVITDAPAMNQSRAVSAARGFANGSSGAMQQSVSVIHVDAGPDDNSSTGRLLSVVAEEGEGSYIRDNERSIVGSVLLSVIEAI